MQASTVHSWAIKPLGQLALELFADGSSLIQAYPDLILGDPAVGKGV